ncbi:hypothetical protein ACH0HS_001355 [Escherichia coli]|nr:hypothetical protein [Escherichia coli]
MAIFRIHLDGNKKA